MLYYFYNGLVYSDKTSRLYMLLPVLNILIDSLHSQNFDLMFKLHKAMMHCCDQFYALSICILDQFNEDYWRNIDLTIW